MTERLTGTGALLRLALTRDRLLLPPLVLAFVLVTWSSAAAADELYPDRATMLAASRGWNATPAVVALHGVIYDPGSLGSAGLVKMTGLGTALLALTAALLVVRHTRADEEVGRTELAAAGVVGRWAPLAAALAVGVGTGVVVGALSGAALVAAGLPVAGSVAFGAAWAGAGAVAAGVGAVAAQVSSSSRGARGAAAAALGATYLLRAVGDVAPATSWLRSLRWLSPFGWSQQVRAFADDRWVVLLLPVAGTVATAALALALLARRDLGSGLVASRPGPPRGEHLGGVGALVWRLHRPALVGWLVGTAVAAALLGTVAASAGDLLGGSEVQDLVRAIGGVPALQDAFLSTEIGIVSLAVTGFGISVVLALRAEEADGRSEALLSTALDRRRYALAHVVLACAGTAALLAVAGLASGGSHALVVGDAGQVPRVLGAALARLPAVWVLVALTAALLGLGRRWAPLAWGALAGSLVLGEFGPLMRLPDRVVDLSPWRQVPSLPGGDVDVVPLVTLVLLAAALVVAGLAAYRARDLTTD